MERHPEQPAGGVAPPAKQALAKTSTGQNYANYKPSGLLTLSYQKYAEPKNACVGNFRLYQFEDHDDIKDTLILAQKSHFVVGSGGDADVQVPGTSAHHCILQSKTVNDEPRLWLVAFETCWVNSSRVAPGSQVQLNDKDSLRFGSSDEEFLLIDS